MKNTCAFNKVCSQHFWLFLHLLSTSCGITFQTAPDVFGTFLRI